MRQQPTKNSKRTKISKLAIMLAFTVSLIGCADPAFQQYIEQRQAAVTAMPSGPAKFYEQARLDEQVLAEKRRQQAEAAQAAAAIGAGMQQFGYQMQQQAQFNNALLQQNMLNNMYRAPSTINVYHHVGY
jgi:hypothetical protein